MCAPFGTPLDLRPSNAINRLTPVPAKVKPLSDLQKVCISYALSNGPSLLESWLECVCVLAMHCLMAPLS